RPDRQRHQNAAGGPAPGAHPCTRLAVQEPRAQRRLAGNDRHRHAHGRSRWAEVEAMYEPFFGLESSPFGLTPDPRFLFRSRVHHEILSLLLYGVTTSKGVMLLLGDVGTGKTTLCRALLRELPEEVESVLLLNPHLSETELVGAILDDLGLERRGKTRGELMTVLSQHLVAAGGEGKTVLVIVDEAQQMSVGALEQV